MAQAPLASLAQGLLTLLARFEIRLFLSACIILSLLPYEWVDDLAGFFLLVFGLEFSIRVFLVFRADVEEVDPAHRGVTARSWRWPSPGNLALLALDLLALLSFLPMAMEGASTNRFLRIFRLTRMLLLIGYWAPLARDIWLVLARRERSRQVVLMGVFVMALSFTGAVIIENVAERAHTAVDFDGDGELTRDDRHFLTLLWWAFRQIQDPGNMISGPMETTAMVVSLGLTVFGLFLVSFLIGLGTDVVRELMELSNLREPGLRGHTVIVNITPATRRLLHELTRYYEKLVPEGRFSRAWLRELIQNTRRGVRGRRYLVVGPSGDPPEFLRAAEMAHVVYRPWTNDDAALLKRTDMPVAQRVMLLANLEADDPDAETLQTLLTLVERPTGKRRGPGERPQLLIAEILDESAIPAARTAIAGSGSRAFIVPSERLLALFMAATIRRPRSARLLDVLLGSHGHELYTCYFDVPGLAYRCNAPPALPEGLDAAMRFLVERGRGHALQPLGLLTRPTHDQPHEPDVEVCLNPAAGDDALGGRGRGFRGFVAIAANFAIVRDYADTLSAAVEAPPPPPRPESAPPAFTRAATAPMRRVLICGFRSATVSLIEALVIAEPAAQILVLVESEAARAAALDDFDARTNLVRNGLLSERHGIFTVNEHGALHGHRVGDEAVTLGRIEIAVGDFTSSRRLVSLPRGFGHAASMDVVAFLSTGHASDARIAKAMMKLEALITHAVHAGHPACAHGRPRMIAQLFDSELARRLRQHFAHQRREDVQIVSTQALRALFLYQSVIVPSFDAVYAELLGPWGQSLLRMDASGAGGAWTYDQIAAHLADQGAALIGLEVRGAGEAIDLWVGQAPEADQAIAGEAIVGAWVISRDQPV